MKNSTLFTSVLYLYSSTSQRLDVSFSSDFTWRPRLLPALLPNGTKENVTRGEIIDEKLKMSNRGRLIVLL